MGRTFNPERAEQEANKIGLEFAHSNDVVKDMSRAYHVDFSNIRVHTDSAADNKVKAAGKDALAQGNDVFFGKGIFESSHPAAKSLVAHEFAHTMQQGAAMGSEMAVAESAPMGVAQGGKFLDWFKNLFRKPEDRVSFAKKEEQKAGKGLGAWWIKQNSVNADPIEQDESRAGLYESVQERIGDDEHTRHVLANGNLTNASRTTSISGLSYARLIAALQGEAGEGLSKEDIGGMYENLLAGAKASRLNKEKSSVTGISAADQQYLSDLGKEGTVALDDKFDAGVMQLKGVYLAQLRRLKERYGTYMTQMHPEDFASKIGPEVFDHTRILQDVVQLMEDGDKYFDYENNPEDREFKLLAEYYNDAFQAVSGYITTDYSMDENKFQSQQSDIDYVETMPYLRSAYAMEGDVAALGGPGFTAKQQKAYEKRVQKRQKDGGIRGIWGRFRNKSQGLNKEQQAAVKQEDEKRLKLVLDGKRKAARGRAVEKAYKGSDAHSAYTEYITRRGAIHEDAAEETFMYQPELSQPNQPKPMYQYNEESLQTASDMMDIMGESYKAKGEKANLSDIMLDESIDMYMAAQENIDERKPMQLYHLATQTLGNLKFLDSVEDTKQIPPQLRALYEKYKQLEEELGKLPETKKKEK